MGWMNIPEIFSNVSKAEKIQIARLRLAEMQHLWPIWEILLSGPERNWNGMQ